MWNPIATAPQTVPIIGAWRDEDGWHFSEVQYDKGKWMPVDGAYHGKGKPKACEPTLWANLPVAV